MELLTAQLHDPATIGGTVLDSSQSPIARPYAVLKLGNLSLFFHSAADLLELTLYAKQLAASLDVNAALIMPQEKMPSYAAKEPSA